MKRFVFLLLLSALLLSGCTSKEAMYIKPFELTDKDINKMLTRGNQSGVFEYNIKNIKMITIEGVKYEQNKEPETFFSYQTVSDPDFFKPKSKFIFQLSQHTGSISLLTEYATAEKVYDEIKSLNLSSELLRKETAIEPDINIPLLVMPGPPISEEYPSCYNLEFYMTNPEVIEQYQYMIIFSITFHSNVPSAE